MPRTWGRLDECGVGLLVGENQVAEVTAEAITVESVLRHTWLRFYGAKVVEVTGLAVVIETIIVNLSNQAPAWLLLDANWVHTQMFRKSRRGLHR
jgi:hypothetical protein